MSDKKCIKGNNNKSDKNTHSTKLQKKVVIRKGNDRKLLFPK